MPRQLHDNAFSNQLQANLCPQGVHLARADFLGVHQCAGARSAWNGS
jgi:hypothetical protein